MAGKIDRRKQKENLSTEKERAILNIYDDDGVGFHCFCFIFDEFCVDECRKLHFKLHFLLSHFIDEEINVQKSKLYFPCITCILTYGSDFSAYVEVLWVIFAYETNKYSLNV